MAIVILHYKPIEFYPTTMALLEKLKSNNQSIYLFSSSKPATAGLDQIQFTKIRKSRNGILGKLATALQLFLLNVKIRNLISGQSSIHSILYFEALSYNLLHLSKNLIPKRGIKLCAHFYEYFNTSEIKRQSRMEYFGYNNPKHAYEQFSWISHSTELRRSRFIQDFKLNRTSQIYTIHNFPPLSWRSTERIENNIQGNNKLKLVYLGALSIESTFILELLDFCSKFKEQVTLDVYSWRMPEDLNEHMRSLTGNVKQMGSINHSAVRDTLNQYDIGIIMYKPLSDNVTTSLPNKLFEYWACNLNVWIHEELHYCREFVERYPHNGIKFMDFSSIATLNEVPHVERTSEMPEEFISELELEEICTFLTS